MKDTRIDMGSKPALKVVESRRAFLKQGGAALGMAAVQVGGLAASGISTDAYAATFSNLGEQVGRTLMRMARDIYPHDKLEEKFYAAVIDGYNKKSSSDSELKTLITNGVNKLNTRSVKRFGKQYADLPSEGDRLVLLYGIEQSSFFQKVRGDLLYGIYNNKSAWSKFGYEGSSWEKGGYIDRGFNDIDWV